MTDDSHHDSDKAPDGEKARDDEGRRGRGLLDSIIPDLVRKAINQGAEALGEEKLKETVVAELFRKAVDKGGEVVGSTEESVRKLVQDMPLPKEVVDRLVGRVDDYKAELFRVVRSEVHDFLDRVDLGHELQKMLTSLSFEITTEVRFIPNDKGVGAAGVKPDVKAKARVKRARKGARRSKGETPESASKPEGEA